MTLLKLNNRPVTKTFDSLFDEFFNAIPSTWGATSKQNGFSPATNIHETNDSFHLELNVPGRNKEDFKINLDNGILTISFEKLDDKKNEEYKTIRREFSFESFSRSFTLTEEIDVEKIQAKYENGVLKLNLPKKEKPANEAKQINIQ